MSESVNINGWEQRIRDAADIDEIAEIILQETQPGKETSPQVSTGAAPQSPKVQSPEPAGDAAASGSKNLSDEERKPFFQFEDFREKAISVLSENEKKAIKEYRKGDVARRINTALRSGDMQSVDIGLLKNIDSAFQKSMTPVDLTVYRDTGVPMFDNASKSIGKHIEDKGFFSTSLNLHIVGIGKIETYERMKIRVPKGTKAIPGTIHEEEIILNRGSRFRIIGTYTEGGMKIIEVEIEPAGDVPASVEPRTPTGGQDEEKTEIPPDLRTFLRKEIGLQYDMSADEIKYTVKQAGLNKVEATQQEVQAYMDENLKKTDIYKINQAIKALRRQKMSGYAKRVRRMEAELDRRKKADAEQAEKDAFEPDLKSFFESVSAKTDGIISPEQAGILWAITNNEIYECSDTEIAVVFDHVIAESAKRSGIWTDPNGFVRDAIGRWAGPNPHTYRKKESGEQKESGEKRTDSAQDKRSDDSKGEGKDSPEKTPKKSKGGILSGLKSIITGKDGEKSFFAKHPEVAGVIAFALAGPIAGKITEETAGDIAETLSEGKKKKGEDKDKDTAELNHRGNSLILKKMKDGYWKAHDFFFGKKDKKKKDEGAVTESAGDVSDIDSAVINASTVDEIAEIITTALAYTPQIFQQVEFKSYDEELAEEKITTYRKSPEDIIKEKGDWAFSVSSPAYLACEADENGNIKWESLKLIEKSGNRYILTGTPLSYGMRGKQTNKKDRLTVVSPMDLRKHFEKHAGKIPAGVLHALTGGKAFYSYGYSLVDSGSVSGTMEGKDGTKYNPSILRNFPELILADDVFGKKYNLFNPERFIRESLQAAKTKDFRLEKKLADYYDSIGGDIKKAKDRILAENEKVFESGYHFEDSGDADRIASAMKPRKKASKKNREDYKSNGVKAKAFKNWFGDWENDPKNASKVVDKKGKPAEQFNMKSASKVINSEGEPVIVYHGTSKGGFDTFSKDKIGRYNLYGKGFYFTEDNGIAEEYSSKDAKLDREEYINAFIPEGKRQDFIKDVIEQRLADFLTGFDEDLLDDYRKSTMEVLTVTSPQFLKTGRITDLFRPIYINSGRRYISPDEPGIISVLRNKYGVNLTKKAEVKGCYMKISNPYNMDLPPSDEEIKEIFSFAKKWKSEDGYHSGNMFYWKHAIDEFQDESDLDKIEKVIGDRYEGTISGISMVKKLWNIITESSANLPIKKAGNGFTRQALWWILSDGNGGMAAKETLNDYARNKGFDGLYHTGGWNIGSKNHKVWIAFEPNQMKAVDNDGDFSAESDNLYESAIFEKAGDNWVSAITKAETFSDIDRVFLSILDVSQDSWKSVNKRIDEKYADIIDLPEVNEPDDVFNALDEDNLTEEMLSLAIEQTPEAEKPGFIRNLKSVIADKIGDLKETYRYESFTEGHELEKYIDGMLETIRGHESNLISGTGGRVKDSGGKIYQTEESGGLPADSRIVPGKNATTYLPDNTPIDFTYAVIEADDLITSHTDMMYVNPEFPQERQPRARDRAGMQLQIGEIANKLNPERLAMSPSATSGAPIIDGNRVVESGNGRTMAIRRAYKTGKANEYRQWIVDNAKMFGVPEGKADAMREPVLVRVRQSEMDAEDFARKANQGETAQMSPSEIARADAERITDGDMSLLKPTLDGYLGTRENQAFINKFIERIGISESAGYLTKDGHFTRQLLERVQAAIFQKAYKDDVLLEMMIEEANPAIRNIITGLTAAAGAFSRNRLIDPNMGGMNIPDYIVAAAKLIRKARQKGMHIEEIINQSALFAGTENDDTVPPEVAVIARFLSEGKNIRSGKRLGLMFRMAAEKVTDVLKKGLEGNLFGEPEPKPTASEIVEIAIRKMEEKAVEDKAKRSGKQDTDMELFESANEISSADMPFPETEEDKTAMVFMILSEAIAEANESGHPELRGEPELFFESGVMDDLVGESAGDVSGWEKMIMDAVDIDEIEKTVLQMTGNAAVSKAREPWEMTEDFPVDVSEDVLGDYPDLKLEKKDIEDYQYLLKSLSTEQKEHEDIKYWVEARNASPLVKRRQIEKIIRETDMEKEFPISRVRDAFSHVHLSPHNSALVEKERYEKSAESLRENILKYLPGIDNERLEGVINDYKTEYLKQRERVWNAASHTYSSAVAGRNKFNKKQADKRGRSLDNAESAFSKWRAGYLMGIESKTGIADIKRKQAEDKANAKISAKEQKKRDIVKWWMNLKPGDEIPVGNPNGNPKITKKNKFSVSSGMGVNYSLRELTGLNHKEAQKIMDEMVTESIRPILTRIHDLDHQIAILEAAEAQAKAQNHREAA